MDTKFIIQQRNIKKYSQEYMAERLGISRPTYIQIEKGQRELTLSEAQELAKIFGLGLADFIAARNPAPKITIEKEQPAQEAIADMRISIPQRNLKKFKEVLLYILNKVGSKPNIGESVINKLLYFIDFDYYEKYEEQLMGATYIKNHYGPTPCELKKVIENMKKHKEIEEVKSRYFKFDQKKYLPLRTPDLKVLNAREMDLIDNVLDRLSDKNAAEIRDYSHSDVPFKVHQENEKIDYESVFYRGEPYSVRSYRDEL
ncbi:MAG: type II toxin-antitoxin system antitoxin SocA domain-containing protein [bacterium]